MDNIEKRKRGRPSKSNSLNNNTDSQVLDNSYNQSSHSDIPYNNTIQDTNNNQKQPKSTTEIVDAHNKNLDDEIEKELEEFSKSQGIEDIPSEEFNPLGDAVTQRSYTDGSMGVNNPNSQRNGEQVIYRQEKGSDKVIDEPKYTGVGHSKKPDVDATLINPSNSQNEVLDSNDNNYYNNNQQTKNSSNNSGGNQSNSSNSKQKEQKEENDNLKELSPKEQRESVEKTADIIIIAYKQYIPAVFTHFGSHNVRKLKELEKEGEIDLNHIIKKDGTRIIDYINDYNKDVEFAFKISEEEAEAIKTALVDVLMEQKVAFTATQRLMFVLGQFLVAKIMLLVKFIKQKNSDLQEMRENYILSKELKEQNERILRNQEEILKRYPQQPENTNVTSNTSSSNNNSETKVNNDNIRIVKNESSDAEILEENKKNVNEPTLEDALEASLEEDDIPN